MDDDARVETEAVTEGGDVAPEIAPPIAEEKPPLEKTPAPKSPRFAALREGYGWFRDHYLTMDPRTLGLFRLVLGFLVTGDCLRHWYEARVYYSNAGVLTNHYHLFLYQTS